jgi:23S rRNA (uracil1939-C5)-methyltransferase
MSFSHRASTPVVRLTVERVVAGGDGLARADDGRVVFVPGGLPGEIVDVELVGVKKDFARSRVVELVQSSPLRVDVPCASRLRGCGGCDWQHISVDGQLELKAEIVREALRRTGRMPDAVVSTGGSVPAWEYRTSMRLAVDRDGRPGLHRTRSNDVVDVDGCLVAHPAITAMLPRLCVLGADEISLRVSGSDASRTAWWTPESMTARGLDADVATGNRASLNEQVAGRTFRVSAPSFFQSGPAAAELLVATIRGIAGAELDAAACVIDAYGGVGVLGATCSGAEANLIVVEGSPSACADARHNLAGRRATVYESGVEQWTPVEAQVVIADPSRQGIGVEGVERLAQTGAATMVLVSCDPVSLARDAALLAAVGYALTSTVVLDLFPQTHHVEAVSRFDRLTTG